MTDTAKQSDGLDFFSSLMYDIKTLNDTKKDQLVDALPKENKVIADYQNKNAQAFCDELYAEATAVNEHIVKLREKVNNHHNQGPGKSFLKASLKVYEKVMPDFDLTLLRKTLAQDVTTCQSIVGRMDEGRDLVVANYPKFIAQQQLALRNFIAKQQKIIYGRPRLDFEADQFEKTKKSDEAGKDSKVKTSDKEYTTWLAECFNESEHPRLDDDENFDDVALKIANKCRDDWSQFHSPKRTVVVAILSKPCTREDMDHGNRGSWPVMEYAIPDSDWTVVIKYTYQHSDEDNKKCQGFEDAMKAHKPVGFAKDDVKKEEEEVGGDGGG